MGIIGKEVVKDVGNDREDKDGDGPLKKSAIKHQKPGSNSADSQRSGILIYLVQ